MLESNQTVTMQCRLPGLGIFMLLSLVMPLATTCVSLMLWLTVHGMSVRTP